MLKLVSKSRNAFGKGLKKARAAGDLPGILYGPKEATLNIFVDVKQFKRVFREAGESSVIDLATESGDKDVLIKDVAFHSTSGEPIHVDFYAIEKGKKVEVDVPLVFDGVSPAVKDLGGTLVKVMHELPIEAMPKDLPHNIAVDISVLVDLESQILVKDLKIPAGVELKVDGDEVVAAITVAKEEEEAPAEPVDLSAIEVEKKGKQEEEGEEETPAE